MNRGTNTIEHWEQKHINEYDIYKPYDFDQLELSPNSYHKVASEIIQQNKDAIKNKTLLEIGCAGGYFCSYMKRFIIKDWPVEGWDFSKTAIKAANERNKLIDNLYFNDVDILHQTVYGDNGIICSFETIEHIEEGKNYQLLNDLLCSNLHIRILRLHDNHTK